MDGRVPMIPVEKALELVLSNLPERKSELVPLRGALGYVLSGSLVADSDVPPFDRSAMDGYAVRARDVRNTPADLECAGEVKAGSGIPPALRPGEAMAIMTGAPLPEGADAVQMVEHTKRFTRGRKVRILKPVVPGDNVAPRGAEAARGDTVLGAGRLVGPAEMAVLATFGFTSVRVWSRPRIAVLVTGDELVEVEEAPGPGQIRNSNAYSVAAQLRLMNLEPEYLGIARDDPKKLRKAVVAGLERDVLIMTGGVSMGEYDFAKKVFRGLGLEMVFTKVAMKPGKPTVFARKADKLVFGLPGNPVSSFVAFENLVRPALGRLCGLDHPEPPKVGGRLLSPMKQHPGRTAFLPAWVTLGRETTVEPLKWKGSADIIAYSRANAAVIFPADREVMDRGEMVEAMLLPDFFARQR